MAVIANRKWFHFLVIVSLTPICLKGAGKGFMLPGLSLPRMPKNQSFAVDAFIRKSKLDHLKTHQSN